MRVIVTGASGFIGSVLCGGLTKMSGWSVVPVSRTQHREGFYVTDDYSEAPTGDVLVHLGEDPDRARVNSAGDEYFRKATKYVGNLLGRGYGHVIYASSSVIYGDAGIGPYTEDMDVVQTDTYTNVKIENEKVILAAGGTVVRIANILGPGMAENNVISDIISQLSDDGSITVRNGSPIRDFVWIGDVVKALILLIRERIPGIFNVGTGVGISIMDLARVILAEAGESKRDVKSLAVSSDYSYNVLNVEKMKKQLDWEPEVAVSESIRSLVNTI